jgi:hypothetical protein
MYADPLSVPLSSSPQAPTATVSPLIATLVPKRPSAAPSPATSLARCVHPAVRLPAASRVKMYADPLSVPLSSSP